MRQEVQADKLCLDRNNQYLSCGEPPLDAARGCICNSEHPRTSASGTRGCALSVQRFLSKKTAAREWRFSFDCDGDQSSTGGDEDGQAAEMISHVHDPKACTAHQRSSGRGDCEARLGVLLANTCSKATRASAWSGDTRHAGTRRDIGALARGTARRDGYRRSDLCARESQYRRTNQGVLFLTVPLELVIEVRVRKSARRTACTKTDTVTGTSSGCNRPVPNVRTAR